MPTPKNMWSKGFPFLEMLCSGCEGVSDAGCSGESLGLAACSLQHAQAFSIRKYLGVSRCVLLAQKAAMITSTAVYFLFFFFFISISTFPRNRRTAEEMFLAYLTVFLQFFLETQKVAVIISLYHVRHEFDRRKRDARRERKLRRVANTLCPTATKLFLWERWDRAMTWMRGGDHGWCPELLPWILLGERSRRGKTSTYLAMCQGRERICWQCQAYE